MSISNFENFLTYPFKVLSFFKTYSVGRTTLATNWLTNSKAGVAPTTAAVCDNTTTGALNKETDIGLSGFDWRFVSSQINTTSPFMQFLIADRLCATGGLVANTTSTQTTNLPTAPLTRYTDGNNVFAALEVYVNTGSVSTTFTCSYTNQNGTPGQTSKPAVIGGTNAGQSPGKLLMIPLADGDTGVRSVESVTLAGDTTDSGNFGVTLFRVLGFTNPIRDSIHSANVYNAILGGGCHLEPILPGACLMTINNGLSRSVVVVCGNLNIITE